MAGSADDDLDNDPGLITHRASQGGYNYYADDDPYDDFDDQYDYDDYDDYDDDYDDYDDPGYPDDPDDDMSEAARKRARRKTIWRRVRRTCYVAAALMLIVPGAAFAWCYFTFDITPPDKTAENYNTSLVVNYADGSLLNKFSPGEGGSTRVLIEDVNEVSPAMKHATMAAEDADFYSNPGFSVTGIARAMYNQISGGQGGGSTITQQYVKLTTGRDDHTLTRKFTEVVRAYKMTNQYKKDTILKAYLNTAYYGRGAYGIYNAADAYFGKKPSQLNAAESAVLAGMVQLPTGNDPRQNPEQAQNRWDYVTGQMADNGWVDPGKVEGMKMPETRPRFAWRGNTTGAQIHIKDRIVAELEKRGYTQDEMTSRGLQVVTTIDKKAQQAAVAAVEKVMQGEDKNMHPALTAVDPRTGAVRAYYGGKVGLDWAAQPQEPGSSFKPFVTMTGLKQGQGIGQVYDGSSPQDIAGTKYANAEGVECDNPKRCGVREATTKSVNTAFVNMANKFGPTNVAETAYEAGIPRKINGDATLAYDNGRTSLGVALGAYPVSTLDMSNAYAALADGKRAEPRFVKKIVNADGELVENFGSNPQNAFAPSSSESKNLAANVTESMLNVADYSELPLNRDRPVASKSGTHQFRDTSHNSKAWYVGYTPRISTAVSLGANDNSGQLKLIDQDGSDIYGAEHPGRIWREFMNAFLQGKSIKEFPKPEPIGQFTTPPPSPSQPPTSSSQPPSSTSRPPTSEPSTSPSLPTTITEPTEEDPGGGYPGNDDECTGSIFDPPSCDEQSDEDNPGNPRPQDDQAAAGTESTRQRQY